MQTKFLVLAGVATLLAAPAFAQETTVTTVTKEKPSTGAKVGVVGGAAAGAVVGGPVGAVVGGVAGAVGGAIVDPPKAVTTYVRTTHVDPVAYDGPIVVGQVLPDTVTVYEVPKYERYRWTYVNHQRILIDHKTGKVISIMNDDQ